MREAPTGGDITINTDAGTTVTGNGFDGIGVLTFAAGNIDVNAQGTVTGSGNTADGIFLNANFGTVTVETGAGQIKGIRNGVSATALGSTVSVTTGTGLVIGTAGDGIDARAAGAVTVGTSGSVTGTGGAGINAASTNAGLVSVTTSGGLDVEVTGTNGDGITASTTGAGTIAIVNATETRGSDTGIEATSGGGAISITNDFVIQNTTQDDASLAIRTTGGATNIDNNASITGRVITGAGADLLTNDDFWFTQGDSDFGAGSDTVANNSFLVAANDANAQETTRLLNLENLNNNGRINLLDDGVSDRVETSGNYSSTGGMLGIDASLGGPGSVADQLVVGGNAAGVTRIVVNDTNPGAGGFNPDGILVVDVSDLGSADATNFVLANGPIHKGLFTYSLLFDDPANNYLLVGLPEQKVFETLAAVASNQEIWRETADAWSTRQENLRDILATSYGVTAVADPPIEGSTAPMGSLWASAIGSWSARDSEGSFSILNANLDFDLSYHQDIYGVVGGADFGVDTGTDSRLLFGVMGGYVDSSLDFDDSGTSIDTDGATVGASAALLSNGFFATILVKADILTMDFSTGETDGDDRTDVTTIGARGDFGYRFGDELFVEPMVSFDAMSTDIDDFTIAGSDIDAGTNESYRAGAGVRLGYGGETMRASATARVWDVFSTDNEVDVAGLGLSDDDLEGVYGDVSGQVDANLTSNTTFYLKGGILFSDDVTKPNASGGFAFYW